MIDEQKLCNICHGTGEEGGEDNDDILCTKCDGVGWVNKNFVDRIIDFLKKRL